MLPLEEESPRASGPHGHRKEDNLRLHEEPDVPGTGSVYGIAPFMLTMYYGTIRRATRIFHLVALRLTYYDARVR
jgi:hypothetical protein